MENQEKRKQFFEKTVKGTRFEQLSVSSDIGQGIIMGYEQALKDNKQTEIDIIYRVLEPLIQLQEKCLQQMTWCDNGIITYGNENIAEERVIDIKGQKEAYSDVFSAINNKVERLEHYLKHGNYGEL